MGREGERLEGLSKKGKDSGIWTTMWGLLGGRNSSGLNGNGKNTIKIKFLKLGMYGFKYHAFSHIYSF